MLEEEISLSRFWQERKAGGLKYLVKIRTFLSFQFSAKILKGTIKNDPHINYVFTSVNAASLGGRLFEMKTDVLQFYHPLIIEGMGDYDPRDPSVVALQIMKGLEKHWVIKPPELPVLLVTQGDPYAEKGISAITRRVADELNILRAMVYLDANIAGYHEPNADHYKVVHKVPYSQLTRILNAKDNGIVEKLSRRVYDRLEKKNKVRKALKMPELAEYFYDFAMLQEVAKIGLKQICGALTLAHTSSEISPFSVTSFYEVGMEIGRIKAADIVPFAE